MIPIPSTIKLYAELAAAAVLLCVSIWFVHHERDIGRQSVVAADAAARADEHQKVLADEKAAQAKADLAESDRDAMQKQLHDYLAAHPIGVVRVCRNTSNQPAGVSATPAANAGNAGTRAGSTALPAVPAGGPAPDVGPALDAIVRSAATLGGLYRQYQAQPVTP